ncbi:hypothetical protein DFH28DRAFT_890209, partial [Melampsora americana]
ILSGETRVTIFAASGNAATYTLQAGDVGYIHEQNGHHVECISTEHCHFLEVLKAPGFEDVALAQWLAVIPRKLSNLSIYFFFLILKGFLSYIAKLVENNLRVSKETVNTFCKKVFTVQKVFTVC